MKRLLLAAAAFTLLLAACTNTTPNGTPTGAATSGAPSMTAESASASTAVTMSCSDAFASVNVSDLTGIASLQDAQAKLDTTISACPTLDDWTNAARTVLPSVDLSQARDFLKTRCETNASLSSSPLCTSVSG